jgi:NAD(P)H-nitrite reductase large subunit
MIVCHCALVTQGELLAAIEDGATSLDELTSRCGASMHCGGCRPAVARILESPTHTLIRGRSTRGRAIVAAR